MLKNLLLAALAFALLGLAASRAEDTAQATGEEHVIRQSVDEYCDAFNRGDVDAVMVFWSDDADYIASDGQTHRGKQVIRDLFQDAAENLKGYKLGLSIDQLQFVKPDVAIEDGTIELTSPAGDTSHGNYTTVWIRSDGKWLIQSARELPSEEAKTAEETDVAANAEHLKSLEWLVGDWISDDNGPAVELSSNWALDKNFLVQDYTVAGDAENAIRVTQWIGYDPSTGQIRSWTFDSRGGLGEAQWTRDGNTWNAQASGILPDGRIGTAIHSVAFVDDTHLVWRSTGRNIEGQPLPDVEVKFVRRQPKQY